MRVLFQVRQRRLKGVCCAAVKDPCGMSCSFFNWRILLDSSMYMCDYCCILAAGTEAVHICFTRTSGLLPLIVALLLLLLFNDTNHWQLTIANTSWGPAVLTTTCTNLSLAHATRKTPRTESSPPVPPGRTLTKVALFLPKLL